MKKRFSRGDLLQIGSDVNSAYRLSSTCHHWASQLYFRCGNRRLTPPCFREDFLTRDFCSRVKAVAQKVAGKAPLELSEQIVCLSTTMRRQLPAFLSSFQRPVDCLQTLFPYDRVASISASSLSMFEIETKAVETAALAVESLLEKEANAYHKLSLSDHTTHYSHHIEVCRAIFSRQC